MKKPDAKSPKHLTRESRALWTRLVAEYGIDDTGGLAVLLQACEALDRLRQAQAAIAADGAVVLDRFGQQKPARDAGDGSLITHGVSLRTQSSRTRH